MDKAISFCGEGVGIFPDYWATTEDLNDTRYSKNEFLLSELSMDVTI